MVKEFISSIKVEGNQFKEQPKIDIYKYFTARAHTAKNFRDGGFDLGLYEESELPNNYHLHQNPNATRFFAKVDTTEVPISQKVTLMVRLQAPEFYKQGRVEKQRVKQFLKYSIQLSGVDFLGNNLTCKIENEGESLEPVSHLKIITDEHGRQSAQNVFSKLRPKYYIEFSKANVDKILKDTGTDKNTVKYAAYIGHSNNPTSIEFKYIVPDYNLFTGPWDKLEAKARSNEGSLWVDEPRKKIFIG